MGESPEKDDERLVKEVGREQARETKNHSATASAKLGKDSV